MMWDIVEGPDGGAGTDSNPVGCLDRIPMISINHMWDVCMYR